MWAEYLLFYSYIELVSSLPTTALNWMKNSQRGEYLFVPLDASSVMSPNFFNTTNYFFDY